MQCMCVCVCVYKNKKGATDKGGHATGHEYAT